MACAAESVIKWRVYVKLSLYFIVDTTAADDLATCVARSSAAIVSTLFSWSIPTLSTRWVNMCLLLLHGSYKVLSGRPAIIMTW